MFEEKLKKAIQNNLGNRSPSIIFEICPDRLINRDYSYNLTDEIFKKWEWEVLIANHSIVDRIPETAGLYMFVWKPYANIINNNGTFDFRYILYVGKANSITSNLRTRFSNEYINFIKKYPEFLWEKNKLENREDRLKKYLNLWEIEYWFCSITNSDEIKKIEKFETDLIETFTPPINFKDKPKSHEIETIIIKTTATIIEKPPF